MENEFSQISTLRIIDDLMVDLTADGPRYRGSLFSVDRKAVKIDWKAVEIAASDNAPLSINAFTRAMALMLKSARDGAWMPMNSGAE